MYQILEGFCGKSQWLDQNLSSKAKKGLQNDLALKEMILSSITRCFTNAFKTQLCQRKEKFRVTISMWMLLHKQAFKRQSAACAQNETATIKCLWPDVHQSVVFSKILNKSNRAISGRTSKRKSHLTMCPVRKWRTDIVLYAEAGATHVYWTAANWALWPETWLWYLSDHLKNARITNNKIKYAHLSDETSHQCFSFNKWKQRKLNSGSTWKHVCIPNNSESYEWLPL